MRLKTLTASFALSLALTTTPLRAESEVVATIPPLHSLVSSVMKGIGEPALIVDKTTSPHTVSLKPSQANELQNAKIIFWIGESLETPLAKPIETIGKNARVVELLEAEGLKLLEYREHTNLLDAHDEHEGHAHKDEHDHNHEEEAHKDDDHDNEHSHDEHEEEHEHEHEHAGHDDHDNHQGHNEHHDHDHGGSDPHIWLNTDNAITITRVIEKNLSEVFPQSADTFAKNADETIAKISALADEIPAKLHADHARPFLVFHDAYHYFEDQFGFKVSGVINLSPASVPGAKHLKELREAVTSNKISCIYTEPQFSNKMAKALAEGSNIKLEVSDPLGADLNPGPDQYFQLMNNLAISFGKCFEH